MKLYKMSGGMIMTRRGVCTAKMSGGYSPLLLQAHHGAGIKIEPAMGTGGGGAVDMSRAKNLLNGLTIGGAAKKKRYISI